jgi:hypothetical protein
MLHIYAYDRLARAFVHGGHFLLRVPCNPICRCARESPEMVRNTRNCSDLWEGHGTANEWKPWKRQQEATTNRRRETCARNISLRYSCDDPFFSFLFQRTYVIHKSLISKHKASRDSDNQAENQMGLVTKGEIKSSGIENYTGCSKDVESPFFKRAFFCLLRRK